MEDINQKFDVMKFLEEFEKYPCLWDKTHPDFKNKHNRSIAEEILLNFTEINDIQILRKKIRNICVVYNQELRKIKSSVKEGKVYTPRLLWFSTADKFLRSSSDVSSDSSFEVLTGGSSDCEITNDDGEDFNDDHEKYNFENYNTINGTSEMKYSRSQPQLLQKQLKVSPEHTDDTSTSVSLFNKTKFKKRNKSSSENDIINILKNHIITNHMNSTNEFVAFGNSIAAQLQKMPLDLALQLQADIQSLISNKRLQHLQLNK